MSVALLDLDGTLIDSRVGITRSVQYALRQLGLEADDLESLLPFIGPPLRESFAAISGIEQVRVERAILAYREYYVEKGILENVVYPGVPNMLRHLVDHGWRLAVATSKPTVFAERILDACELRGWFEVVAGADLDGTRERKADVIAFALESLSKQPDTGCVMVGDREHDVIGAKLIGIPAVGVTWGYGSAEELRSAGADLLIHQVPELPAGLVAFLSGAPHAR